MAFLERHDEVVEATPDMLAHVSHSQRHGLRDLVRQRRLQQSTAAVSCQVGIRRRPRASLRRVGHVADNELQIGCQ